MAFAHHDRRRKLHVEQQMSNRAFDKFDLTGRKAVVTGGSTGMGYYMARGLARSGARVLIAHHLEDFAKSAALQLTDESGVTVLHDTVDLSDRANIKTFTNRVLSRLGSVDIFVGNTPQDLCQPVEKMADRAIDQMFQVNVSSLIEIMRAFIPGMRQKRWGRIILSSLTTSLAGAAQEDMGAYTATTGALNSLAHASAAELGHDDITVNSIVLGMYKTESLTEYLAMVQKTHGEGVAKAFTNSLSSMTANGRLGRPDEVEGLIQLLASNAGGYITGTNLCADGGMAMMFRPNPMPAIPIYPPLFRNLYT